MTQEIHSETINRIFVDLNNQQVPPIFTDYQLFQELIITNNLP